MMSGLMLVFLFIAIGFMIKVESQKDAMLEVVETYNESKANLNEALHGEFENDLKSWNANITKNNTVVFNSPEVLFEVSKSEIKDGFKTILEDFFPRFVKVLTSKEFIENIEELRVEGHTSDEWGDLTSKEKIYLNNMQLSQQRAYEVLSFCYALDSYDVQSNSKWLEKNFRANGMAFSKMKDKSEARRVEFTIYMKSENKIYEILELE